MSIFKTEIASDIIPSDNPVHQRLLKPYTVINNQIRGDVLELGCGEGRGIEEILSKADTFLGLDKIDEVIKRLQDKYPDAVFKQAIFPPISFIENNSYDFIISFQVIEHVKDDRLFLEEIYRLLKPGGVAVITTPNIKMSLSRNPWHIREYTAQELLDLSYDIFDKIEARGISGNDKVMQYHAENKKSVERIMRFDILDLQHRLPAFLLKVPYEILNRMNRNKLKEGDDELVASITYNDFIVTDVPDESLDLFYYLYKKYS
jgi:SAM-dependent methyltransferase